MIQVLIAKATHSYCNSRFYFSKTITPQQGSRQGGKALIATEAFASANATHSNNEALASLYRSGRNAHRLIKVNRYRLTNTVSLKENMRCLQIEQNLF
jgi:hypothetical protein